MTDKDEYRAAVTASAIAASLLSQHDIPALLAAIARADAAGPFIDPTLWREKHQAMTEDKRILEAALPLHQLGVILRDYVVRERDCAKAER
jgi:hypothetical protein